MISFELDYPYKDSVSKSGDILRCGGLRTPTYEFWEPGSGPRRIGRGGDLMEGDPVCLTIVYRIVEG